jgi:molybdenum cofactor cytidylyltransferase
VAHAAAALAESIAQGVIDGGVAVVPPGAAALAWSLGTTGLTLLENPNPAVGISSSLRTGIAQVAQWTRNAPRAAILVVLADQPNLRSAVIARLVESWRSSRMSVRPRYTGSPETPGHPVLLDQALWSLCDRLEGDAGFRDLLDTQPIQIIEVAGSNPDVDTPEDLHEIEGRS